MGLALGLALGLGGVGCAPDPLAVPSPVTRVADVVLDASVVEHVAQRDELEPGAAQAAAIDVLRLAAAAEQARAERAAEDAPPLVAPARREQIVRASRARLWLDEGFAKTRTTADMPEDDPMLARELASPRNTHPELHRACQVVVIPNVTSRDEAALVTQDPAWRARAQALIAPVAARIERYVPAGDQDACTLMGSVFPLVKPKAEAEGGPTPQPDLVLRFEGANMFDLTACAQKADDGSCAVKALDTDWTDRVATMEPATYSGVFATGWGLHAVYLEQVEPASEATDPAVRARIKEQLHAPWLAEQLATYVEGLQRKRAVRIAAPSAEQAAPPAAPPSPEQPR